MRYLRVILQVLIVLSIALFVASAIMFGRHLTCALYLATVVFGAPIALPGVLTFFPLRALLNRSRKLSKDFILGCISTAPIFVLLILMKAYDGDSFSSLTEVTVSELGEFLYTEFIFFLVLGGCAAVFYALLERAHRSWNS